MVKGFFKNDPVERLSDGELVKRALRGSKECWRELVGRYSKMISSTVWKITGGREADDVIQEVLIQLFQSLGTFRSESSFSTFLYRLTVNTACNEVKRMTSPSQAVPVEDEALAQLADDADAPDDPVFDSLERGEISRKVGEALEMVGIVSLRDRMVQTLSDGERQKVMIAKALAQETPIIFLDEPTAFLDYPSKVDILHLLHRLSREAGKTVFLSTHDLELALQIADRIWLMDKGGGVHIGTPEDLTRDGSLERFFNLPDSEKRIRIHFDLNEQA